MNTWISIDTQLPDKEDQYPILYYYLEDETKTLHKGFAKFLPNITTNEQGWAWGWASGIPKIEITHWFDLPEKI